MSVGKRRCRQAFTKRQGFTLAEMIAAIALLAVFSVIVVQLFAAAHTLARRTDRLDGAVLCARNIAEAWQAGQDPAPGTSRGTDQGTAPGAAGQPANPFAGAGTLTMARPARLGFDGSLQPVAPTDASALYLADLALSDHQPNGTDELKIVVSDASGNQLFALTAVRLIGEGVAK